MNFRCLTVSGSPGVGKSRLIKELAKKLAWPIFSVSQLQRQYNQDHNLSINVISQTPDYIHQEMDQLMIEKIKTTKNEILESHLCGWQARNFSDILRILCLCEEKIKIERYSQREHLSLLEAKEVLELRNQSHQKKFTELYQASDYLDPKHYQLIIDTSKFTPEEEVKLVLARMKKGY